MNFEETRGFWDDRHSSSDQGLARRLGAQVPVVEAELSRRLDMRQPYDGLLDLGCGDGRMLPYLGLIGRHVWAADISPVGLAKADGRAPNVSAIQLRMPYVIPLKDASVDVATLLFILQSITDDVLLAATAAELRRVLKPGPARAGADGRRDHSGPGLVTGYRAR